MKHQGTKRMETERLVLRRFTIADAGDMYQNWASDPEVTKFLTWEPYTSKEAAEEWLSFLEKEYEKAETYIWCLEWKETGEAIGSLGAFISNEKAESLKIGYSIGRKFWYRGITAEALRAVVKYLTEEVSARRLEARHDVQNPNSGRVLQKCGFQYEGTALQADWNNTGIYDVCLYGLVKRERSTKKEKADPIPKNVISDETIEYVGILAKLELSPKEKEQAKRDMGRMLDYINMLNELDTDGVEPMSHVFPIHNVFREDVVENGDVRQAMLKNAPEQKDGSFKVPKTVE